MVTGGYKKILMPTNRITVRSDDVTTKRARGGYKVVTGGYKTERTQKMEGEDIFKLARTKTPPPDDLDAPGVMLYTSARNIYKAFNDGVISKEQAQGEKLKTIKLYNNQLHVAKQQQQKREQLFRLSDELADAMIHGKHVIHTHMGMSALYTIKGMIARYTDKDGWSYSLELQDLKSGCIVYAALEETEVQNDIT